jgi:hypothetical protein
MAKEPGRNESTEQIKAEIARSRDRLAREFRGVRSELNVARKIRRSFRQNTGAWIGAAVAVGAIIMLLPRRKKVYVNVGNSEKGKSKHKLIETGFWLGALRIAATMLKPTITRFVMDKMRQRGRPRSVPYF